MQDKSPLNQSKVYISSQVDKEQITLSQSDSIQDQKEQNNLENSMRPLMELLEEEDSNDLDDNNDSQNFEIQRGKFEKGHKERVQLNKYLDDEQDITLNDLTSEPDVSMMTFKQMYNKNPAVLHNKLFEDDYHYNKQESKKVVFEVEQLDKSSRKSDPFNSQRELLEFSET
ncbi:UNKNOWN [Stylonychia lemnae]|uniref:Uncharacterized protein n=1 Tax=Stylonychia lemnae TaxID=5949 RepID=A0A077ZPV7_STYLE|nr:UNKNOWN [Stylonychia lemnae]|eukprot:CDW71410.1 UNKNOWN [Stylonychia lemnae]